MAHRVERNGLRTARLGAGCVLAACGCTLGLHVPIYAQPCSPAFLPTFPAEQFDGRPTAATLWDPDGAGPAPQVLVVGGEFDVAGRARARRLAVYDFATGEWSALADVEGGSVSALLAHPDGSLWVGGSFTAIAGVPAALLARFDGATWTSRTPFAAAAPASVNDLLATPDGAVLAAGNSSSGGVSLRGEVARWNSGAWTSVVVGGSGIRDIDQLASGEFVLAGSFTQMSGAPARGVARSTDLAAWTQVGAGLNALVTAVAELPDGRLVASGSFTSSGGVPVRGAALFDGAAWSAIPNTPADLLQTSDAFVTPTGSVLVDQHQWNGAGWTRLPQLARFSQFAAPRVHRFAMGPDGDVIVLGAKASPANSGIAWRVAGVDATALGPETINGEVLALAELPPGDLVVGGTFTQLAGVGADRVARWNGVSWSPMGEGFDDQVSELLVLPSGALLASGSFTRSGAVVTGSLALWNGAAWQPFADPSLTAGAIPLTVSPEGDLVATRRNTAPHRTSRWTGTTWTNLGQGWYDVSDAAYLPSGHLLQVGRFDLVSQVPGTRYAAMWDGTQWSPASATPLAARSSGGLEEVLALANGDAWIAGSFGLPGPAGIVPRGVARLRAGAWQTLGDGFTEATALDMLHDGSVVVGGNLWSLDGRLVSVASYDGLRWNAVGAAQGRVHDLLNLPGRELIIAGGFESIDGVPSRTLARWTPDRSPWIAEPPQPRVVRVGESVVLSVLAARDYPGVTVRWERDGVPVTNGAGGASTGGGVVQGAVATLPSPTTSVPAVLTILNTQASDAGNYTAVLTNPCGEAVSIAAAVSVLPACDSVDFNSDGVFPDAGDLADFLRVLGGGVCAACNDPDFNNDGVFPDDEDLAAFVRVLGGGAC